MEARSSANLKVVAAEENVRGNQRWQLPIMFASLILGIVIAAQFRSSRALVDKPQGERTDLIALVKNLESERNRLSAELVETRERLNEIEVALGQGQSLQEELVAQFEKAKVQAGLMAMKGPGVIVRMADSPRSPGPDEDPYFYIVHDVDMQALVNELWAAGAEAVSVNDQRMVTRSSIRCVGPTILVNANRLASPYVIKAIGPAADLL